MSSLLFSGLDLTSMTVSEVERERGKEREREIEVLFCEKKSGFHANFEWPT